MRKTIILIIFLASVLFADFGFDVAWQRRWNDSNLYSAAVGFSRWEKGYLTAGFNFLPAKNAKNSAPQTQLNGDTLFIPHSYYGGYSGYHFYLSKWFRPGVVFGVGWEKEEKSVSGVRIGYTGYSIVPYFGLDIHCLIFSFRLSNEGIGCGLNFRFGG
jgi:hypothetical protein